jgi:lysozyme
LAVNRATLHKHEPKFQAEVKMAQFVKGIDISKHKPEVDWELVRSQGIRFVYIKATQADDIVDQKFAEHWANAKQAGILRGAYHFMDADVEGKAQAKLFLSTVNLEPGDLPPVLDIERLPTDTGKGKKGGKSKDGKSKDGKGKKGDKQQADTEKINAQMVDCANSWLEIVRTETGRTPLIYSRANFLETWLTRKGKSPAWALKYPIWIAQYFDPPLNENTLPVQAKGWQPFTFWQYSSKGELDGVYDDRERTILTPVDLNFFNGTLEELYQFAGAPLPADTPGGTS